MGIGHLLRSYWDGVGGNVEAMPLEALAAALAGLLFRKPLRRLASWAKRRVLADVHGRLDGIEEAAHAARRIAADTHKHVTGDDHPAAPRKGR